MAKASALTLGNPRGCCAVTRPASWDAGCAGVHLDLRSTRRKPMRRERLVSLVVGAVLILGVSFASAQQPAPATPPPPPPPYGAPITLEQAKKVLAGAEAEAKKNSWNMVIVVMDSGGNLVALERMDGAQLGSIEVARDKAYSAVAFRRPTKAFDDALAQGG